MDTHRGRRRDTETAGNKTTAIGTNCLGTQNVAGDSQNTAVGYNAGFAVTTGIQNALFGHISGDSLTDADHNTAIGAFSLNYSKLPPVGFLPLQCLSLIYQLLLLSSYSTLFGHR